MENKRCLTRNGTYYKDKYTILLTMTMLIDNNISFIYLRSLIYHISLQHTKHHHNIYCLNFNSNAKLFEFYLFFSAEQFSCPNLHITIILVDIVSIHTHTHTNVKY